MDTPEIADAALQWRLLDLETADAHHFDVTEFVTQVALPRLAQMGRRIEFELVDSAEPQKAWVSFGENKLFVREDIWVAAQRGLPMARVVVAHELGHLALHSDQVFAFTQPATYGHLQQGQSAEFQANWFAWAFLLPDAVLLRSRNRGLNESSIATIALVPEKLVEKRIEQVALDKRYRKYAGDQCPLCGQELQQNGVTMECDCGYQVTC